MDLPGAVIAQVSTLTRQINGIQSIMQELNGQFSRMIATGTRMVSGLEAEGTPSNPFAALISPMSSITEQMASVQRTLSDISSQVSRMITTASRIATGAPGLYQANQTNYAERFHPNFDRYLSTALLNCQHFEGDEQFMEPSD